MTFLPIVERELRVAARKAWTYWLRSVAAFIVIGIFLCAVISGNGSASSIARELHEITTGITLAICLLAGVFQTSDCLSSEKRDGTIGLLFLTDLRGYDVILGKLVSSSINVYYALLSILPVLALPLLMGGVSGAEFGRVVLLLVVALFLSLSVGIFVSAITREARVAMALTAFIMIVLTAGLPAINGVLDLARSQMGRVIRPLMWPSLGYGLYRSIDFNYRGMAREFWGPVLTAASLALSLLILAVLILPRAWKEKGETKPLGKGVWQRLRFGTLRRRRGLRRTVVRANPFYWLAMRDRLPRIGVLLLMAMAVPAWLFCLGGVFLGTRGSSNGFFAISIYLTLGCGFFVKAMVAAEASRRLHEDHHSGALELMLVTPLSVKQILAAQKRALREQFRVPLLILLAVFGAMFWLMFFPTILGFRDEITAIIFAGTAVSLFADFYALGWLGMWAGLRSRRHHFAILSTLLRVIFLPWFVFILLGFSGALDGPIQHGRYVVAGWFVAGILNSLFWGLWARRKLRRHFRAAAANLLPRRRGWWRRQRRLKPAPA